MILVDPTLGIPGQVWAVLRALEDEISVDGVAEDAVSVSSRAFYSVRGGARGFAISWRTHGQPTLNVTVTEHGSSDNLCATWWHSEVPLRQAEDRPDHAPCIIFEYRDVRRIADYVEALAKAYLLGKSIEKVLHPGGRSAE